MTKTLAAAAIALLSLCPALTAESVLPLNRWIEAQTPTAASSLDGLPQLGTGYYHVLRASVSRNASYTLVAECGDGRRLVVLVRGHDPRARRQPEPPTGAGSGLTIDSADGRSARASFRVDARSEGDTAYVVFVASEGGRPVRLMLKTPAEADPPGSLYVTGRAEGDAAPLASGPLPLNRWVDIQAPTERSVLAAYTDSGPLYHSVFPVRLARGGRYTLFAEWGDGKAVLLEVRGSDPAAPPSPPPSGCTGAVALNISGGSRWRINFAVDPRSGGDSAWLCLPSREAGRSLRVMLKSPGDPDAVTAAPVKGATLGSVFRTPLHLAAPARR